VRDRSTVVAEGTHEALARLTSLKTALAAEGATDLTVSSSDSRWTGGALAIISISPEMIESRPRISVSRFLGNARRSSSCASIRSRIDMIAPPADETAK